VGIDGVIAIAEFIPLECADDTNIYVFWVFQTKVEEQDEDELADAHTETDSYGQLSIKEDLFGFVGRSLISLWKKNNLVIIDADSMIYIIGSELEHLQLEPLGIMKLDEFISDILITTGSKDYLGLG
jgi:hypothetical protein